MRLEKSKRCFQLNYRVSFWSKKTDIENKKKKKKKNEMTVEANKQWRML